MFNTKKLGASLLKHISNEPYLKTCFNPYRFDKYGPTNLSFDGRWNSKELNKLLLPYLSLNNYDKMELHSSKKNFMVWNRAWFHRQGDFQWDIGANSKFQTAITHHFLKCYKGNKMTIIDPSYKSLYTVVHGESDQVKWESPYANKVFSLPPVFVGNIDDLDELNYKLKQERKKDIYHHEDDIVDWYHNTKIQALMQTR